MLVYIITFQSGSLSNVVGVAKSLELARKCIAATFVNGRQLSPNEWVSEIGTVYHVSVQMQEVIEAVIAL